MAYLKMNNKGVKIGYRSTDYWGDKVGGVLPYKVLLESGDWDIYLPTEEIQWGTGGDKVNCVTQASNNVVETRFERLRKLGKLRTEAMNFLNKHGFFDKNEKLNLNDRIPATLNGTGKDGAYLSDVCEWTRKNGIFPESVLPSDENLSWDDYYDRSKITNDILAIGKESLEHFDFPYEWVETDKESLMRHLKQSPLQAVLPGHDVENFNTTKDVIHYFDTYVPHKKQTNNILFAMKNLIIPKGEIDSDELLVDIEYGEFGSKVIKLLKALRRLGWGYKEHSENWGDLYDDRVKDLVFRYIRGNLLREGWTWWWHLLWYQGKVVDAPVRESINNTLKFRK